ncbi:hypothetical protein H5410_021631 [Solanum commersonii]|uniref:Uncharacterized protein n=1 Tax=Solanum commersonii TaxID=4109 RepID=A0A9J5ZHS2_SOLCO|nr:hypothetical protein H5410_021631 [Solanum commersonii]
MLGIYVIFAHIWTVTKKSIYEIFNHFRAVMKRSKVLLFYSSRYSKVINACRIFFEAFLHFRAVTKRSKVLFFYSSRYSKVIGASRNVFEVLFVLFLFFLIFWQFMGIYVKFDHFWAVTKRSKVFLFYSSRYSKIIGASIYIIFGHFRPVRKRSQVFFFSSSRYSRSLVQVKKIGAFFRIVYIFLLIFRPFWGIYVIVASQKKIEVCFVLFIYKRIKVLFLYLSRYFKVIGASQKFLKHFLYCLCVFPDFSAILGNLRNIRPFAGNYEKKFIYFGAFT